MTFYSERENGKAIFKEKYYKILCLELFSVRANKIIKQFLKYFSTLIYITKRFYNTKKFSIYSVYSF